MRAADRWMGLQSRGSDRTSEGSTRGRGRGRESERLPSRRRPLSGTGSAASATDLGSSGGMRKARSVEGSNIKRISTTKAGAGSAYDFNLRAGETMFAMESKQHSIKRGNRVPIKMLIEEEMLKKEKPRRRSPSLIARLMGLDELPIPEPVHEHKKELESSPFKITPMSSKERCLLFDDTLKSTREQKEFKDVYEVLETSMTGKRKDSLPSKGLSKLGQNEKDMDFIRQKFLDVKRLSTDENFQNSKEFADALDVLNSNKDIFLKILQEPNSLSTQHESLNGSVVLNSNYVPSNHQQCHVTVLKSSKVKKSENSEVYNAPECHSQKRMDALNSLCKYQCAHFGQPYPEHSAPHLSRLKKNKGEGKTELCTLPTRIVVLKPSLHRAQRAEGSVPFLSPIQKKQQRQRCYNEFRRSESPNSLSQFGDQHVICDNVQMLRDKRTPKENYSGTSKHGRQSRRSSSLNLLKSEHNEYSCHEISHKVPWNDNINKNEVLPKAACCFDDWNRTEAHFQCTGSPVSREAEKHLSHRLRTSHMFQDVGYADQVSSTLGEMLAFSDREACDIASTNEVFSSRCSPSGITSMDEWKDGCFNKLARSRSLSASSSVDGTFRRRNQTASYGNEDFLMIKDVFSHASHTLVDVNDYNQKPILSSNSSIQEDQESKSHHDSQKSRASSPQIGVSCQSQSESIGFFDNMVPLLNDEKDTKNIATEMAAVICDAEPPSTSVIKQIVGDGINIPTSIKSQGSSPDDILQVEYPSPSYLDAKFSIDCGDGQQPSPVSVLEPSQEEDDDEKESSPECFERLSADLQELRLQLNLLKSQSASMEAESEIFFDEDVGRDCVDLPKISDAAQNHIDEDDMNFSYLLDMLAGSGFHDTAFGKFSNAACCPGFPVGLDVFEDLERMYDKPSMRSRAERKLTFDFTNFVLSEIAAPDRVVHPSLKGTERVGFSERRLTAEDIWHLLVRRRNELSGNPGGSILDFGWPNIRADVENVGCELEKMLIDELMDSIVSELYPSER